MLRVTLKNAKSSSQRGLKRYSFDSPFGNMEAIIFFLKGRHIHTLKRIKATHVHGHVSYVVCT